MTVELKRLSGSEITPYLADLARLRISVFREYPYLYDGDEGYEARYLERYVGSSRSLAVLVLEGTKVIGASTALPLADEVPEFKQPFTQKALDVEQIFYFGESILLPAYRKQGWGRQFFAEREARAKEHGFRLAAFCAVDRPADHPHKPTGYQPLDAFWQRRGFTRHPELFTEFSWKELGEAQESSKRMTFWLKDLG